jgi:hypothetical protein
MASDKYTIIHTEIEFNQYSPSHSGQTMYTPGKASSKSLDQNWPTDFIIPTGTPAVDGQVDPTKGQTRSRVFVRGGITGVVSGLDQRQIDSDNELVSMTGLAVPILGIVGDDRSGSTASSPLGVYDDPGMPTQDNSGVNERQTGYNGIVLP